MRQQHAALVARVCRCNKKVTRQLAQLAAENGGEDQDPWPALLCHPALGQQYCHVEAARQAAGSVVRIRIEALETARYPEKRPNNPTCAEAWQLAGRLRLVEFA